MTTGTPTSPQAVTNRDIGDDSPFAVSASIRAATPSSIESILLADGWHTVQNCQMVQFALGEAHSPITPSKLFAYLVYTDTDTSSEVYTPMGQILGITLRT